MEDYTYEPLDLNRPATRLLRLCHGNSNAISCELFQTELHQQHDIVPYEALSYTWGSPDSAEMISVNGYRLMVTHNLYQALLHLRHEDQDRILWVDAICINQKDNKEKGHQVGQMGDIYKQADRVIFHLGPGSYATDIFMKSLQLLNQASDHYACEDWSMQDSRWRNLWPSSPLQLGEVDIDLVALQRQGLLDILGRPWFHRVWILQEVAFSSTGIISCGTKSVSAHLFGLATMLLGVTPDTQYQSVLDIMPSPWRASSWWNQNRSFYKLLLEFGCSEATDPRDLVYALRGMASDLIDKSTLPPDYEISEETLVADVCRFIHRCELDDMEWEVQPRTIRELIEELIEDLLTFSLNICMDLAKRSLPLHMETVLKNPDIPVNQELIKAAAQYDKTGEVVDVLLRCRGEEFEVDGQVLLCAAKNKNGAIRVFEVFSRYKGQLTITEAVFLTALMQDLKLATIW
ncbi:HET domain-containing protein [Trichoderma barbatum]